MFLSHAHAFFKSGTPGSTSTTFFVLISMISACFFVSTGTFLNSFLSFLTTMGYVDSMVTSPCCTAFLMCFILSPQVCFPSGSTYEFPLCCTILPLVFESAILMKD